MFATLRLTALALLLSCGLSLHARADAARPAQFAEQQLRDIATRFPGRMSGSPAEMLAADYLQQQFSALGFQSDTRQFNTSYIWHDGQGQPRRHKVTATSVIAARAGTQPQEILILAHLDTWTPLSDAQAQRNVGGLRLQGADDNASGLALMLALAQRLGALPLHYGVRFVALSASDASQGGMEDYLARMSAKEKKNTLLVINLHSLIVGDRLCFNSGAHMPGAVRKQTSQRALALARSKHIAVCGRHLTKRDEAVVNPFDKAGFPLLEVTSGKGFVDENAPGLQRARSAHFPEGTVRHETDRDNLAYLDRWLPGRIARRMQESVSILLPLLTELTNPQK